MLFLGEAEWCPLYIKKASEKKKKNETLCSACMPFTCSVLVAKQSLVMVSFLYPSDSIDLNPQSGPWAITYKKYWVSYKIGCFLQNMAVPYKIWWFPTKNRLLEHLRRFAANLRAEFFNENVHSCEHPKVSCKAQSDLRVNVPEKIEHRLYMNRCGTWGKQCQSVQVLRKPGFGRKPPYFVGNRHIL